MTHPATDETPSTNQQQPAPDGSVDPFRSSVDSLASQIEERPPLEIDEAPQTRSSRHLYWMIGALCALTIGIAEIGILMRGESLEAPAPPPEVLAAVEQDPCAARLTAIMDGIAAYVAQNGKPPATLDVLHPTFLPFAPVDPATNQPYGYEINGESVALTCPSVERGAASGATGAPGG